MWVLAVNTFQQASLNFEGMKTVSVFGQFTLGLRHYAGAFSFIRQNGLRHWYGVALVGTLAIMLGVREVFSVGSERASAWLMQAIQTAWGNEPTEWIGQGIECTAEGLLWLLTLWLQFKFTKFIVLVALSPVFALATDAVAKMIRSEQRAFLEQDWRRLLIRGMRSAVLLVLLEFALSIALFACCVALPFFVPALGILTLIFPWLSGLLSIWFYGAASLDYAWEQLGLGASAGLRASWKYRGLALGVGLPFFAAMTVPVLGFVTGPLFGGLLCLVAGLTVVSQLQEEQ